MFWWAAKLDTGGLDEAKQLMRRLLDLAEIPVWRDHREQDGLSETIAYEIADFCGWL